MKLFRIYGIITLLLFSTLLSAQDKYYTKNGNVSFFSATSVENINANNRNVVCLLDKKTGDLQFAVLLKAFEFKKALMQEHFNSDFVESHKYSNSEFKGQITNNSFVNYNNNGTYTVNVKGKLTLHGITKEIETIGTLVVNDGKISAKSVFNLFLVDYNISIPRFYSDNISKSIKITVDCSLDPLN